MWEVTSHQYGFFALASGGFPHEEMSLYSQASGHGFISSVTKSIDLLIRKYFTCVVQVRQSYQKV